MVFFANAQGAIRNVVSSPVYQGSSLANEVVFVGPFPARNEITVSYQLPNGIRTKPLRLAPITTDGTILDGDYNAWYGLIDQSVTEWSGSVEAQFYIYSNRVVEGESKAVIAATSSAIFNISKGVPLDIPATPSEDIYGQILAELTNIYVKIIEAASDSAQALTAASAAEEKSKAALTSASAAEEKSVEALSGFSELAPAVSALQQSCNLDALTTTDKSSVVAAVNEVNAKKLSIYTPSSGAYLYGCRPDGRRMFGLTQTAEPGTIPFRDTDGTFRAGTPKVSADVANKGYVDNLVKNGFTYKEVNLGTKTFILPNTQILTFGLTSPTSVNQEDGLIYVVDNGGGFYEFDAGSGDFSIGVIVPKVAKRTQVPSPFDEAIMVDAVGCYECWYWVSTTPIDDTYVAFTVNVRAVRLEVE